MRVLLLLSPVLLASSLRAEPPPEGTTSPSEREPPSGSATVSLPDLVALWKDARNEPAAARPPAVSVVLRSALEGRVAAEALHLQARFEVKVLPDAGAIVPLLRLEPDVYVEDAPALSGASLAAVDGSLCLVAEQAGDWAFDVALVARARAAGRTRTVEIVSASPAVRSPLRVEVDEGAFLLIQPRFSSAATEVFPENGRWRVVWQAVRPTQPTRPPARPPLEPRVTMASASWVSTLEGLATLRVRYDLEVDREQTIVLDLPEHHRLARATVNGHPIDVPDGRHVSFVVGPAAIGDSAGSLEVVLSRSWGVFHLSGQLRLELPRVSWPVAEIRAHARLPAVFHYRRAGGSMEQVEDDSTAIDGAESGVPGQVLRFRQHLVANSAPTVHLTYSVDLSGQYFK